MIQAHLTSAAIRVTRFKKTSFPITPYEDVGELGFVISSVPVEEIPQPDQRAIIIPNGRLTVEVDQRTLLQRIRFAGPRVIVSAWITEKPLLMFAHVIQPQLGIFSESDSLEYRAIMPVKIDEHTWGFNHLVDETLVNVCRGLCYQVEENAGTNGVSILQ